MYRRFLYRGYRFTTGLVFWLRRRFTQGGLLIIVGLGLSAALGLDTNLTTAYQAFTFLLAIAAFSLIGLALQARWRRKAQESIVLQRLLPRFGSVGMPVSYSLIIRNPGNHPQPALTIFEDAPDPRPTSKEYVQSAGSGWMDKFLGYDDWNRLIARNRIATWKEQQTTTIPPRSATELRVELQPRKRGHVRLDSVTLGRSDLFGLCRSLSKVPLPQSLLILPKRYPVGPSNLPGNRQYQQGGVAQASSIGESEEFVSLREYRPGDPLRRIHWKSWAKTGKAVVKEYQDEFFVRHALILDTFTTRASDELFEEAVSVAASYAASIDTQDSLLDLMFVGSQAYCFTAGRGVGHTERLLEILSSVQLCAEKNFASLHNLVMQHAGVVSGCICVFLQWDEPRQKLVALLRSLSIPIRVLILTEATSPELTPGPMADLPNQFHQLRMGKVAEGLLKSP